MALTTYTELKAAIASWSHRSDLTAVIPDFIALSERRIMRDLIARGGLRMLESTATIVPFAGAAALPADFQAVRSIVLASNPNLSVEAVPLDAYSRYLAGQGRVYCISGDSILLSPDADDYSVILYYFAKPDALSDSNPSNDLFALAPELYLYAGLLESKLYVSADPVKWAESYAKEIDGLVRTDRMQKWGNNLRVRAA